MKILLVEDDEPLGRSLLQVLTEQGHATMWLRELTPARLHQAADRFDLLLLGIVPPDGSGMELLAMARLEVGPCKATQSRWMWLNWHASASPRWRNWRARARSTLCMRRRKC